MSIRLLWLVIAWIASALTCRAQCADWDPRFYTLTGTVYALTTYDDGSGPALYAGGSFQLPDSVNVDNVAKWNGSRWLPLGTGTDDEVRALAVFDDGSGPALYAGGFFTSAGGVSVNHIARWDGSNWSAVGAGLRAGGTDSLTAVHALCVHDDGSGPALFAGGFFGQAGGVSAHGIAKWDGSTWSALGNGVTSGLVGGPAVYALATFDDGAGSALYAGGNFGSAGGVAVDHVAKWDGSSWSALGSGMSGGSFPLVYSLAAFDDGSGAALHAGGLFTIAGGVSAPYIAKWNGSSWSAMGTGMNSTVIALTVFDDGSGAALYAGGLFGTAGGVSAHRVARWNGASWSAIGSGVDAPIWALATFDDGLRPTTLYAGGSFAAKVTRWNGSSWSALDHGGRGADAPVLAMTVFDDGAGPALFVGGNFGSIANVDANLVARWNASNWSALGSGISYPGSTPSVYALTGFDDGNGPALYAGGNFTFAGGVSAVDIARWDGSSWSPLGSGMNTRVVALASFDDGAGRALYAGGSFSTAGGVSASKVARWDGAAWSPLGTGISGPSVNALVEHDDGSGAALFAGGLFSSAGGSSANDIARWDGTNWSALASGLNGAVNALVVYDDGAGAQLYAAGEFTSADGIGVQRIARWNGSIWSKLANGSNDGLNGIVYALTVFDDGSGPALIACGNFMVAGGAPANRIAKWKGTLWSPLSSGTNDIPAALAAFDDGADGSADLFVGGYFGVAGPYASSFLAEWHGCEPGTTYCFGDGVDPLVTAQCPCGNYGEPGHGCANSNASLGGARLWASGTTNPNTLVFTCEGIPNNSLSTIMRGSANNPGGVVFHDGVQCIAGAIIRFGQQTAGQGGNPPFTMSSPAVALAPGATRYYQVHYRNPNAGFCPPGQFNFSNGYVVTW